jgi:hypothetical protein
VIREFETDHEVKYFLHQPKETVWHGKISVDLRWVGSAQPYDGATSVTLGGSNTQRVINIPYEEFMKLWMEAKA